MRDWIPIPGSAKARLIEAAAHHFELAGFEAVNVTELAAKAGVTTGALYHHFGSKLGLYGAAADALALLTAVGLYLSVCGRGGCD